MAFYYIFCAFIFAVCCNAATKTSTQTISVQIETDQKPNEDTLNSFDILSSLVPGAHIESIDVESDIIPADVKLEAIYPRGLRVSVADNGYETFGFRGNLNQKLDDRGALTWVENRMLLRIYNRWVFEDINVDLKLGDTIYYWVFVTKEGFTYKRIAEEWTVKEFVNEDGSPAKVQDTFPQLRPTKAPIQVSVPSSSYTPSCANSRTEVMSNTNICQGALVFSEEFDKNTIEELAFWDPEVKFPLEPDYPFNVYMTKGTLRLQNGRLIISPLLLESKYYKGIVHDSLDLINRCTGVSYTPECKNVASGAQIVPPVVTGKVTTRKKFNFKYGRVEVRAKLPRGDWLLPEITLEPRVSAYGKSRYESGLMRVAFVKGNDVFGKQLYGGPILYNKEPYRSMFMSVKNGSENWSKSYHNYTMLWKPDGIELFVDGEKYGAVFTSYEFYSQLEIKGAKDVKQWRRRTIAPLNEMFYVSLGLRVGGINDFEDSPGKPWVNSNSKAMSNFWKAKNDWFPTWTDEAEVRVDYVRIYAL